MFDLSQEVVEVELVLCDLLLKLLCLLFVVLFLSLLNERDNIAHPQDPVGHPGGVKDIDGIHLLTDPDKFDRLINHRLNAEGSSTPGIPVELGEHHPIKIQQIVEGFGCIDRILTGHRVDHKKGLVRACRLLDVRDLFHHLLIDSQSSCSIHDHSLVPVLPGILYGTLCNLHRFFTPLLREYLHPYLLTQYFKLIDSSRPVYVAGNQENLLIPFGFQMVGQFGRKGCFAGALQTSDQDNGRISLQIDLRLLSSHQCGQLVMYDLHHQLTGGYCR